MKMANVEMELLEHTKRIREYCDYLDEHVKNVKWAWLLLQEHCKNMHFIWDDSYWIVINRMIELHDMSKVSLEEFLQYQDNFFPAGFVDDFRKKKISDAFGSAWTHHKANNPHHWEHWTKNNLTRTGRPAIHHCVCMICDWIAMSKKFQNCPLNWYNEHKHKMDLPGWADDLVLEVFDKIKDYVKFGEDGTKD